MTHPDAVNEANADQFSNDNGLTEYTVEWSGIEYTVLLNAEDAKRIGAAAVDSKARTPRNKARVAASKS